MKINLMGDIIHTGIAGSIDDADMDMVSILRIQGPEGGYSTYIR